jgi:outer membrane lipoprotein carrier protein
MRLALGVSVLACGAGLQPAAGQDLGRILKGLEQRYNNARTLAVRFEQTYTAQKRRRTERGELFLRKPGRMRWEYATPAGKLFISDGKAFYLYTPDNHRVERTRIKESDDWRAPLAFLLGRLDFERDFKRYSVRAEGPDTWIVAEPRSDRLAYSQVGFLVNASYEIRRLEITGQDRSTMEYRFEGEKLNPPLEERLFRFQAPAGAEVVDTESGNG